jgi:cyclopropane fatty-acyl-phospholipid synthase-like methyltransferase
MQNDPLMPNPLISFVDKHLWPHFIPRLKQQIRGLAEDFWKDGPENLLGLDFMAESVDDEPLSRGSSTIEDSSETSAYDPPTRHGPHERKPKLWSAAPGEISEKMWGTGFVTPGGNVIDSLLIKPLGLTKEMSVLDLSAGLGGRMRRTAEETGAYITGLEPDLAIAERGMQLSVKAGKSKRAPITHYDPAHLELKRPYDCVIARETFYRVADRAALFAVIGKHTKTNAQSAFTDYIVDPEHREHPNIQAWLKDENITYPLGLVEAAEAWAKVGFSLRVHEDLTDFYKAEVMVGMKRLMSFLASGVHPDAATADSVLRRIEKWKHRMKAMEAGMKFYRFYGTKH